MSNLFSAFDPKAMMAIPMNWVMSSLLLIMVPSSFWISKSTPDKMVTTMIKATMVELKAVVSPLSGPGSLIMMISLFFYIFLNNILSLFPYTFTSASHLSFSLSLALPLWVGYMTYSFFYSTSHMLAHLIPMGTPPVLMPFMVIIELLSSLIRPLTLSVRLTANLIAGHLLLTLLSNKMFFMVAPIFLICLMMLLALVVLEMFVSFIQAYVFCVLSTLYVNEANSLTIL